MSSRSNINHNDSTTTTPSLPSSSILDDYGTRYEQLLLEQRKLHSLASNHLSRRNISTTNISNTSTNNTNDTFDTSMIASAMTANRMAMSGMIQSAIHTAQKDIDNKSIATNKDTSSQNNQKDSQKDVTLQGLICLWEHTFNQQQFGNYRHHRQNKKDKKHNDQTTNNASVVDPYMNLWTIASIERNNQFISNLNDSYVSASMNNSDLESQKVDSNDDDYDEDELDEFFEMYPECQAYNKVQVFTIPSSTTTATTSQEQPNGNNFKKRKDTHYADDTTNSKNHNNHHHHQNNNKENNASNTTNLKGSSHQHIVQNPYASSKNQNQKSLPAPSQPQPGAATMSTTHNNDNSWDIYNAQHSQIGGGRGGYHVSSKNQHNYHHQLQQYQQYNSIESHPQQSNNDNQKTNPFCTAKELNQQESNNQNKNYHHNEYNNRNYHNSHDHDDVVMLDNNNNDTFHYNVPHGQQSNLSHQQSYYQQQQNNNSNTLQHNPNRPTLSAGLKRKFQTPKIGNPTNNNKGNTNQMARPSTQKHNTTNNNHTTNNNDKHNKDDENDDLPEALKGLDKELIAKIENEIVDSGDPITFKDIAGLEDAKQTVLELVCWPMKRPDLFTGLRRGPNGLLLFGPPGMYYIVDEMLIGFVFPLFSNQPT